LLLIPLHLGLNYVELSQRSQKSVSPPVWSSLFRKFQFACRAHGCSPDDMVLDCLLNETTFDRIVGWEEFSAVELVALRQHLSGKALHPILEQTIGMPVVDSKAVDPVVESKAVDCSPSPHDSVAPIRPITFTQHLELLNWHQGLLKGQNACTGIAFFFAVGALSIKFPCLNTLLTLAHCGISAWSGCHSKYPDEFVSARDIFLHVGFKCKTKREEGSVFGGRGLVRIVEAHTSSDQKLGAFLVTDSVKRSYVILTMQSSRNDFVAVWLDSHPCDSVGRPVPEDDGSAFYGIFRSVPAFSQWLQTRYATNYAIDVTVILDISSFDIKRFCDIKPCNSCRLCNISPLQSHQVCSTSHAALMCVRTLQSLQLAAVPESKSTINEASRQYHLFLCAVLTHDVSVLLLLPSVHRLRQLQLH